MTMLFSLLMNRYSRHQAIIKMGHQPGDPSIQLHCHMACTDSVTDTGYRKEPTDEKEHPYRPYILLAALKTWPPNSWKPHEIAIRVYWMWKMNPIALIIVASLSSMQCSIQYMQYRLDLKIKVPIWRNMIKGQSKYALLQSLKLTIIAII